MKKYYFIQLIILFIIVFPTLISAQTTDTTDTTADSETSIDTNRRQPHTDSAASAREKLRAAEALRAQKVREAAQERDRKVIPHNRRIVASSTPEERKDIRNDRREEVQNIRAGARDMVKNATSSAERWGIRKNARMDVFKTRQNAFVKQLELSIRNLEHIAHRITERIAKIKSSDPSRDMTEAERLMDVARMKIEVAKERVSQVAAYTPPSKDTVVDPSDGNSSSSDGTDEVNLVKPRQVGSEAIKAIREARDSLHAVIRAIAHAMGKKLGQQATTTLDQP